MPRCSLLGSRRDGSQRLGFRGRRARATGGGFLNKYQKLFISNKVVPQPVCKKIQRACTCAIVQLHVFGPRQAVTHVENYDPYTFMNPDSETRALFHRKKNN